MTNKINEIKEIIEKNNLPTLDELYEEFGTFDIEDTEDFIESIMKKLSDKVSHYIKFLEDIIQPDTTIYSMHESSMFDNIDRKQLLTILKTLIYYDRLYLIIELNPTENIKADYFKKYLSVWKENKILLLPYIEKALSVWKKENNDSEFEGYFG